MKKMIVTANIEFSMENNNGEKSVIKSAANLEVSANNCAVYKQKIGNAAFDCLRMAMEADDTTNVVYSSLNKMLAEENKFASKNTFSIIELEGDCITIYININSTIKGTYPTRAFGYAAIKNMPTRLLIALREKGIIPRVIDANIDSKDKDRIIYSSANENMSEKRILDIQRLICSTSIIYISSMALEALKMHGLKLYVENESSDDKVDRGDTPIEPIEPIVLIKEKEGKTVNTFAGTARIKKVKKPMIHLLTTEDAPHGQFSKKLLCISSITEDNISTLKDIQEARNIDAKRFKHLVSIDSSFFSSLGISCMSLKNKIFKTQSDLLVYLCKQNSEVFVSLDAIEILKQAAESRGLFNVDENLLTYKEIVNKYLNLEHEVTQTPFGPSPQREQMAKDAAVMELENLNRHMAQVGKPKFRGHYTHPYAPFLPVEAAYKRLFANPSQNETLNLLEKINSKVLILMEYVKLTKNADLDEAIEKGLCDLANKALFVIADELMNLSINNKIADLSKLLKLEKEIDNIIEYFNKPVFYLDFQEHNSELVKQLSDTNKNKWSFKLKLIKTTLLGVKSADFPTNVLIHEDTKLNVINHIANSKHMHYLVDCSDIIKIAEISEFKLFMKQRDIDMFRKMIKISNLKEINEAIENTSTRLDNVDIKVVESLSKLTGGNEDEALEFYGAFAKAFKEAASKDDTLVSKIVNNPRWKDMERSAGERASIMKINKSNIVDGNMEVEFLSNVTTECINTEFPDFKLVPRYKADKLIGIIYDGYKQGNFEHSQYNQLVYAILGSGLYMSDEDVEFFLNKEQCESCSKKSTIDHDGNTAYPALEVKDYSLDTLKRLTKSLKSFPLNAHFIIFGAAGGTNELLIHHGLDGIPKNISLYRVCKRKASLFKYLDLGDILLEDLLHAHIYLTPAFVETVCDKLNIDVKTFQRKIFNYEMGRKYTPSEICKRHDFDGDRINCTLQRPLKNPTLDEYAPGLKNKVKEVIHNVSEGLDKELNLTYPIPSVISNYKKTESKFIDIVKRLNMENFNSRLTDTYCLYRYSSDSLLNTSDVYVFLKRSTADDLLRDQKHPLFQHDANRARIEEGGEPYEKISIPKNTVQILHQFGMVFLEKHIGDRGRIPKVSLEELNKKLDVIDATVKAGDEVSPETGEPIDLEMIATKESSKKKKAVELRAETKKENLNIWINPLANLGAGGFALEEDMMIIRAVDKSFTLMPYSKESLTATADLFGKAYKVNKIQSTHSGFIDIPKLILESKCQFWISSYAIVSIQEHFDLRRSEVNDYIFDFGYVKPGEVNAASERVNDQPDIQLRTLTAYEVRALPKEVKSLITSINDLSKDKETAIKDFNHYATNDAGLCKVSLKDCKDLYIVLSKKVYDTLPIGYKKIITKVDYQVFELDIEGVRQINYHLERNQLPKIVAVQVVSNLLRLKEMNLDSNKLNPDFLNFFRGLFKYAENIKATASTETEYVYNNILLYESKLAKGLYIALDIDIYKALPKDIKKHLQYKKNYFNVDEDVIQRAIKSYRSGKAAMPVALEAFDTLS